jgi:excisionase family DNA binding protein
MTKRAPGLPQFVTRQEAAIQLRLGVRQIDRLVRAGELKKVKLGSSRSGIPLDDLARYLEEKQTDGQRSYGSSCNLLRVELLEPHAEAGRIIDEHLATTLPGCIVTSRGKFVNVICHWSLGYTEDRIRTELKRLEATAVLLA